MGLDKMRIMKLNKKITILLFILLAGILPVFMGLYTEIPERYHEDSRVEIVSFPVGGAVNGYGLSMSPII